MGAKSKARPKGRPRGKPFTKGDKRAGRPRGTPNKVTVEVRELSRQLVEDPVYVAAFRSRLRAGRLPPPVETMLWYYAYGKPKETMEVTGKDGKDLVPDREDALRALRAVVSPGLIDKPGQPEE